MGQNIGIAYSLIPVREKKRTARRTDSLFFNLIGTAVITPAIYLFKHFIGVPFWDNYISRSDIALFHTSFNVINTIMLLPFSNLLVALANKAVPGADDIKKTKYIDERFLSTPSLAL